jgi:hypothetical protein
LRGVIFMAWFKPVSYAQTLMVPIILEKQLVPGTLGLLQWRLY